jgi:hypothetical protein
MSNVIQIKGTVVRSTEKAMLISVDMIDFDPIGGGYIEFEREAWVPKRFAMTITDGVWSIPKWLGEDRGLMVWTRPGQRVGRTQEPA